MEVKGFPGEFPYDLAPPKDRFGGDGGGNEAVVSVDLVSDVELV